MEVAFGVLGPVAAWDGAGDPITLKGPRHRAVLARLLVARRRVVPVARLVGDLWADRDEPPADAVGAVRTFVAALRRALEPERPPRTPARLLVTEGPGYALRAAPEAVDAWRFERAVAATGNPPDAHALNRLEEALSWWRGPAYADFGDDTWARAERSRLTELRLHAVELRAEAQLALGQAAVAVPDLDAHVAEHPWREDAWRLLALALYRTGRQGDALAVLRRARTLLVEQLGAEPGPALRRLEADILDHAAHLDPAPGHPAEQVWAQTTAAYDRTVASGARARLESTVGLLRDLAVTGGGGLTAARQHRLAAITAAQELGDIELTARVIGAYDVPAIWSRVDDPQQAAATVAAAERTLAGLPPDAHLAARARLLATVALESRGTRSARGPQAARQAEDIARRLNDPALLAFALNGTFMQTFHRAGLAPQRDAIGAELIALSTRHGLITYEVLGHLVRLQSRSALADFTGADEHAAAADRLSERHELPLVGVFTEWYRVLRLTATGNPRSAEAATAYQEAALRLDGAGMPGLEHGLLPLALLCLRVWSGQAAPTDEHLDWGPYEPWARPLLLLAHDRTAEAGAALRALPDPPRDHLFEALWCLAARAALAVGDRDTMEHAHSELTPAAGELAGAGSGLLTLGPVARYLDDLAVALGRPR
ncbi:AfsR/SARP family transcriptional regulator [Streptomyces sp. MBT65]|uniref:BTAD domain-containing putative transcriptional regulator n=1 Tax=Streptomyces sp. MBT65 TaxID=1488395 RepID=UPI00190D48A7|nr:BTAD domain-containing putative transcriptional regulator [Streptomyces sp. MBT65]MBK3574230.1 AfsR/SARP family transcriptional regulator [Streptomyces sp. MBT65]